MKETIASVFGLLLSINSAAASLPGVPPLSGFTQGNATVFDGSRWATPSGCCSAPGTNAPPTGPGEARLAPWEFGNGSGSAISFLGDTRLAPYASAQAATATAPRSSGGVEAYAYTFYAFELTGDAGLTGQLTKIDVTDSGVTTGTRNNGYTTAQVIVDDLSAGSSDPSRRIYTRQASNSCDHGVCTVEINFADASTAIYVPINHIMGVYLTALARSYVPLAVNQAPATFSAIIDATFTLGPLAASGLSLIFSPGVQQPVPEPSQFVLFLIGLGLTGQLAFWEQRAAGRAKRKREMSLQNHRPTSIAKKLSTRLDASGT